ncbi:MAG: hypothetical protein AB2558_21330 [Candidatus Thiodiazotropha sp.]
MENYKIPSFAVRALKSANLSGTPLVDLHRGEKIVRLTLTWKILPASSRVSQGAESRGGTKDCCKTGPSKPAPSAGKRSCQPGQGTGKAKPAPTKAKEQPAPKPKPAGKPPAPPQETKKTEKTSTAKTPEKTTPTPAPATPPPAPKSPPTPRDTEMTSPVPSPTVTSTAATQYKPKTDEGMTRGEDFVTTESKEDPLSRYRVEAVRHLPFQEDKEATLYCLLRRRGTQKKAIGVIQRNWEHIYVIKDKDSKRHNKIHYDGMERKWNKAHKPDDPTKAVRDAVQRIRGRPILFIKSLP